MFLDCRSRESAELFIVEGRSAAFALNRVRCRQHQAVFSLQGKIPNCSKPAGVRRARSNAHVQSLLESIRSESAGRRFSRLLILCDADADGLHARCLLAILFHTQLSDFVQAQQVFHIDPPLFQSTDRSTGAVRFGSRTQDLERLSGEGVDITYFKGIASMSASVLAATCVAAETRIARSFLPADNAMVSC